MLRLLPIRLWFAIAASWLTLAGVGFSAESVPTPDLIFIFIGQSNMAGRAPLLPEDRAPIPGAVLLNDQGQWEPAANPLNRYASDRKALSMQRLGPGDGFARQLHESLPGMTIGLVVNARGGTKIEEWARGQTLYENTLKRVRPLPKEKLAGVLWHQGEGNARDPEYLDKLVALVGHLRQDLGRPDLPFVAGQVAGNPPVNGLIAQLPGKAERTAWVSAEGLTVFDGVHFDRDSQKLIGRRYADAVLGLVKIEKQ